MNLCYGELYEKIECEKHNWVTVPIIGLVSLPTIAESLEKPPAFEGFKLRKITDDERLVLDDQDLETEIELKIKYSMVRDENSQAQAEDTPRLEVIDPNFYDQSGKRIAIKTGEWWSADSIFCDLDLSPLPQGVKQVRLKMKVKVADKWTIPISAVICK